MLPTRPWALVITFLVVCQLAPIPASAAGTGPAPAPADRAGSDEARGVPPLGLGDWVVNGSELLKDRTVVLDGSLTVESPGELTLSNSTLIVKCAFSDEHWLRVQSGGKLHVVNGSTVAGFNPDYPFSFWVEPGAQVEFKDSNFVSAGGQVRYLADDLGVNDPDYSTVIGGIVVMTSQADIERCVFIGMPIALTLLKTEGVLKNCTFRDNCVGVLSHNANWTFEDCTFERNAMGEVLVTKIGAGAWCWRSRSVFRGCSFNDSYTGIAVDNSTCTATGCSFLRNLVGGVYVCGFMSYQNQVSPGPCGPSVTTVEDCEFAANLYGIARGIEGWLGTEELHLVNGVFRDNEIYGIWWENRIDPGTKYHPDPSWELRPRATWNVTGTSSATDDAMRFNGSIDVGPGGSLDLRRSVLMMDGARPGETGIQVRSGGKLTVAEGSKLLAADLRWPYSLACRPGSALLLEDSLLRDCGWNAVAPELSGPFIQTAELTIRRSVVEGCPTALVMSGAGKGRVEGSRLSGKELAVRLDNSTLELVNSSAGSWGVSNAALVNGSRLVCLNSSLDRGMVDFRDDASRLEVGWYLDVLAIWSDGRPAAGADLSVQDAFGTEVQNLSADAAGRADDLVLWETFITKGSGTAFSPHRLECRSGNVTNTTVLTADRSRSLTVILPDSEPPSVSILSPAPDALLNSGSVVIAGNARDDLALRSVELTVDGFERHTLLRDPAGRSLRLDWNLTVQLPEGSHTVEVAADDTSGNAGFASVPFSIDYTLPKVVILFPQAGTLTNVSDIAVSGIVEPGSGVSVNGVEARTLGSTFSALARLSEGDNLITALAVDAAGNANTTSTTVRLDTLPPRLSVSYDPDRLFLNRPQLNLSGTMEPGASITVNGRAVVLPGLAENFTTLVFLTPGENTVAVRATDAAGNVKLLERRFVLDTVAPSFWVLFPPDGFETNEPFLVFSLQAEAGCDLSAGAAAERVPGPPGDRVNFTLNYTLAEGTNTIVLRAVDAAGNVFAVVREVVLDTLAPALAVLAPLDGSHTSNYSVYVIGTTDPGAAVSVNGEPVAVGQGGDFSTELKLQPGQNRVVVAASDALGNVKFVTINVSRVAGQSAEDLRIRPGLDPLFLGFLVLAAAAAVSEGYWALRRPRRPAARRGPAEGGG
jgi:hypothetical protein